MPHHRPLEIDRRHSRSQHLALEGVLEPGRVPLRSRHERAGTDGDHEAGDGEHILGEQPQIRTLEEIETLARRVRVRRTPAPGGWREVPFQPFLGLAILFVVDLQRPAEEVTPSETARRGRMLFEETLGDPNVVVEQNDESPLQPVDGPLK